jgi:hypothetical protein
MTENWRLEQIQFQKWHLYQIYKIIHLKLCQNRKLMQPPSKSLKRWSKQSDADKVHHKEQLKQCVAVSPMAYIKCINFSSAQIKDYITAHGSNDSSAMRLKFWVAHSLDKAWFHFQQNFQNDQIHISENPHIYQNVSLYSYKTGIWCVQCHIAGL